jgi:hypothetical protein
LEGERRMSIRIRVAIDKLAVIFTDHHHNENRHQRNLRKNTIFHFYYLRNQ